MLIVVFVLTACSSPGPPIDDQVQPVTPIPTAAPGVATWAPWPSALHDARHSGTSTSVGPQQGKIEWRRQLGSSAIPAGPVVGNGGVAYLVDPSGTLRALSRRDGRDRWTADTGASVGGDLSVSPLVLPGETVVAGTGEGLGGWSKEGHLRWTVTLDNMGSLTSPVSADGRRIYLGSSSGQVAAVDVAADGSSAEVSWQFDPGTGYSYGSVVTDGRGRIYTTSAEAGLVAVDDHGDQATLVWTRSPDDGLVEVSPGLSADGIALLGTNGEHEFAYDRDGEQLWSAPRRITYSSPSVTEDGLAYVGEHDNMVHVFDVTTGRPVRGYPTRVGDSKTQAQVWTSVVVDRDHSVYFGTRRSFLLGVRSDGRRLFALDLGAATASYPALTGDGRLLIATDRGEVLSVS